LYPLGSANEGQRVYLRLSQIPLNTHVWATEQSFKSLLTAMVTMSVDSDVWSVRFNSLISELNPPWLQ